MDEREAEMKAERRNSLDGPALGGPDISRSNGSRLEKRGVNYLVQKSKAN